MSVGTIVNTLALYALRAERGSPETERPATEKQVGPHYHCHPALRKAESPRRAHIRHGRRTGATHLATRFLGLGRLFCGVGQLGELDKLGVAEHLSDRL